MYISLPLAEEAPGLVFGQLALIIGILVMLFFLIVFVETVVLQLLRWGSFKQSIRCAFWMNLASTPVGILLLSLIPRLGLLGLLIAWVLSVLIEWAVLARFEPRLRRYTMSLALAANLVSYLLLIMPAFLSSR